MQSEGECPITLPEGFVNTSDCETAENWRERRNHRMHYNTEFNYSTVD